jgi:ABC-2 type transport system ATP-binding protein
MLTCREVLDLHRGFYPSPLPTDDLLALVGLSREDGTRVGKLSGGQQRRIDMALALAGDPALVFLDEPTTGFDPAARRHAWETINGLRALGKTIILTTHYLEEAEAVADRIIVLSAGQIVADGAPGVLGRRDKAPTRITFARILGVTADQLPVAASDDGRQWVVTTTDPTRTLHTLTSWAVSERVELAGLTVAPPSIEDIYLEVTA